MEILGEFAPSKILQGRQLEGTDNKTGGGHCLVFHGTHPAHTESLNTH